MQETPDLINCPNCSRPIIRHAAKSHLEDCVKEKPSLVKVVQENGKSMPNGEIAVMPVKSKKRKIDDGMCLMVDGN